jgi:hypothetical protein
MEKGRGPVGIWCKRKGIGVKGKGWKWRAWGRGGGRYGREIDV